MEDSKKIFISHSAADSNIGEKFLEFLISLGYEKNNIFFPLDIILELNLVRIFLM